MSNAKIFNQDVAFSFYTNERYVEDLVYHTGYALFYLYEDGHYKKLMPEEFRSEVMKYIRSNFPKQNWTIASVKDIVGWCEHECYRKIDDEDRYYIGFKDCIYNTKTFETEPHNKEKIVTYYLPYNFSEIENAETPNFKRFLETSLVHKQDYKPDYDLIAVAQEAFGSAFIDNQKACKAFFLYGESGQNGKSTFTNILRKVVGMQFYSSLSLLDLSQRFTLSSLIGKKANIADELDDKFGSSKMFKQLVAGDSVHGEHKYGGQFDLENRAKFFYSSNVMPSFDGIDGGLRRRILILPFWREFTDKDIDKDYDLKEKLEAELPGIIWWSIQGAKRLVENSYRFTHCKATIHMMEEFEDEASSSLRYFREMCGADKDYIRFMPLQKIYDDYLHWTVTEGSKKPAGKKKFIKDIKSVFRAIDTKVMRYKDDYNYVQGRPTVCLNVYFKREEEEVDDNPQLQF
ncbi:hypothetical protein HGB13_00035 [bacterium]|nr:hypothetical protein [bacterium]